MSDVFNSIELATELTVAWLSNPNTRVGADEVPLFLRSMHEAISGIVQPVVEAKAEQELIHSPAVSVRKSLGRPDALISLIDGKPYKTLRRHLSGHGLTPEQYRERYGLRPDYPMVAPEYSEARRAMAKKIGLGRKPNVAIDETKTMKAKLASKPRSPKRPSVS